MSMPIITIMGTLFLIEEFDNFVHQNSGNEKAV
jgi:hypothetical protein